MYNKHAKSPCCGVVVSRFGGRRRRCKSCHKTFRIRQKKRGRKRLRFPKERIIEVLCSLQPVTRAAYRHLHLSDNAKQKRFQQQLQKFVNAPYCPVIHGGQLTLIIDGLWCNFQGQEWVLYVMAIKSYSDDVAYFLDPVLLRGKECLRNWKHVVQTIPKSLKKRIIAIISDGFNGCDHLAEEHGWIHQRCHFHLLRHLEGVRGKRKKYWNPNHSREQIYQIIRQLITVKDCSLLPELIHELRKLIENEDCPRRLRFVVNDVLRKLPAFRSYLNYPELHLPHTTNVVESMNSLLRKSTNKLNHPKSLFLWAAGYIRAKKKLFCHGTENQPN